MSKHLNYTHPDPLVQWMSESTYRAILDVVEAQTVKGSRILDVGCGRGELMQGFAASGYEAVGCDTDEWCVRAGSDHGQTFALGVEEITVDALGYFDTVILSHVLEHTENPKQAILRSASVCKGVIVVAVPNPLYSPFVLKALARSPVPPVHPRHLYSWDAPHLKTFLEGCGLQVMGWAYDSVALPLPRPGRLLARRLRLLEALEGRALPFVFPRFCRSVIAVARP